MSRASALALSLGVVLGVSAAVSLVVSLGTSSTPAGAGPYRGSEPPRGIAMVDFTLRDHEGRLVRSAGLRSRVTVLTFLDSQCTKSCPVIAWTVARTMDALTRDERRGVVAVAISTDPAEDTRRSVRSFLARNRALGRLRYVGGGKPASELRRVWGGFKILSSLESGHDTLHSAPVRIYDRGGEWVATLHPGVDLTETNLAHDIRVALGA